MKKFLCIILPAITAIYSLCYANFGGFIGNESAMSKIGLEHPLLFAIWGLMTLASLGINLIIGFSKTKYRFYIALIAISAIGMMMTIIFDFDYSKHTEYMLHCIGSMTFSLVTGITVFLLFLLTKKYIMMTITCVLLLTDLILLIIYKETAFIELMPIFAGYIILGYNNMRKEKN
ncbi:MAG: hypothetical protein NC213_09405 [Acetobacter sp.]|nr:hypothetical protein [Bacteroides sp.]MCM1341947.1 hypothetical protein [Acetobacter sp.]MCM1434131.1 hypothetical protein [Clostridiales bacterium]